MHFSGGAAKRPGRLDARKCVYILYIFVISLQTHVLPFHTISRIKDRVLEFVERLKQVVQVKAEIVICTCGDLNYCDDETLFQVWNGHSCSTEIDLRAVLGEQG